MRFYCPNALITAALVFCSTLMFCTSAHAWYVSPSTYDGQYDVACEDVSLNLHGTFTGGGINVSLNTIIKLVCTDDLEEVAVFESALTELQTELSANCSKVNIVPKLINCATVAENITLKIRQLNGAFINLIPDQINFQPVAPRAWHWYLNLGTLLGQDSWFHYPFAPQQRSYVLNSATGDFAHTNAAVQSSLLGAVNCLLVDSSTISGKLKRTNFYDGMDTTDDLDANFITDQTLNCVATANAVNWFFANLGLSFKGKISGTKL